MKFRIQEERKHLCNTETTMMTTSREVVLSTQSAYRNDGGASNHYHQREQKMKNVVFERLRPSEEIDRKTGSSS